MYQFGLIGFPIKYSLSPWIHKQFLNKANMDGRYSIFEIDPNQSFTEEMSKLKEKEIDGFNITVPYKQTIIPYLDEINKEAEIIGAVNTVANKNGKWIGYNTDGKGYVRSLNSKFPDLFLKKPKRILIIGAGGAARGIYYALMDTGFNNIDIANRTIKSASEIAKLKKGSTETSVISLRDAERMIHTYDVIIQTTSIGMKPKDHASIVSLKRLKEKSIVSDIVYQPIETNFIKQAQALGSSVHYGHTMLLYQAQYAFEIWTNEQVPVNNMDSELIHILKGR